MALILAPSVPLASWFQGLDEQMRKSAGFFANKPVIVNLAAAKTAPEGVVAVLDALDERKLNLIGIEGTDALRLAGTKWERLVQLSQWRQAAHPKPDRLLDVPPDPAPAAQVMPEAPVAQASLASLLIDRPVRSGQSVIFEEGDVTIIGSVASGAEIIAGGSIHIYGPLRGRAIAGLRSGGAARIFCQKLLAELVSIDGLYHAPDHWSGKFQGKAVQIFREAEALQFALLD